MIWMIWLKWRSNTLPRFLARYFFFGIINIILFVYFKRHNCSNIVIQQEPYQTDHAHLPTHVSIPRNHSLCHLLHLYWLLGVLLKTWFWPFFDWILESVYPPLWFCWWWDGWWLWNGLGLMSWKMGKAYPNYVYIYILYRSIYTCMCIYIHIHTCIYTCIYIYMQRYTCI